MSVKCLTVVLDDGGRELCVLSVGNTGDLSGHGQQLRTLLRGFAIVHDLRVSDRHNTAVSMGHLAVILIKRLRTLASPLELVPAPTRGYGEEYVYTIYPRHISPKSLTLLNLRIAVFPVNEYHEPGKILYDGLLDEFDHNSVEAEWSHPAKEDTEVERLHAATVGNTG